MDKGPEHGIQRQGTVTPGVRAWNLKQDERFPLVDLEYRTACARRA